jgi:hypothetical protein
VHGFTSYSHNPTDPEKQTNPKTAATTQQEVTIQKTFTAKQRKKNRIRPAVI